jgi:hypothetical protein
MKKSVIVGLLVLAGTVACVNTGPRVLVTPAPGVEAIPTTVAIYPLLTTEFIVHARIPQPQPVPPSPIRIQTYSGSGGDGNGSRPAPDDEGIYISPPTESRLLVTGQSQLFSDLLAADMAHYGFKIKQLPVEAPVGVGDDDSGQQFYVSMELLDRLRDEFGLEAVVLGNVYFEPHRSNPGDVEVRAAYVKVVDVKTLDVLCHVSIGEGLYGSDVPDAVAQIAGELAAMAGQSAPPAQ